MQFDMEMLIYELCNDITEIKVSKNENLIFCKHSFKNMDISAAVAHNSTKFVTYIHEIQMKGSNVESRL